jgi:hypothetical protein
MTNDNGTDGFTPGTKGRTSIGGEFAKFKAKGDAVVGRLVGFGENDTGEYARLSPIVRKGATEAVGMPVLEMNVGLSAGLRNLLTAKLLGSWVCVQFTDEDAEKGRAGHPLKVYEVWMLNEEEARLRFKNDEKIVDFALATVAVDPAPSAPAKLPF